MSQNQKRYKHTGKYDSPYKPEFCERVIELARQDKLRTQAIICLELGISFQTWDKWTDPDYTTSFKPDFFEAVHTALTYVRAKWEQYGIDRLEDKAELDDEGKPKWTKFNDRLWAKFMERYHGYTTKAETKIAAVLSEADGESADKMVDDMWREY